MVQAMRNHFADITHKLCLSWCLLALWLLPMISHAAQYLPSDGGASVAGQAMSSPVVARPMAAVWQPLAQRLAADGLSGSSVDALLATLPDQPTSSPMGRKMRELYRRAFYPRPASAHRVRYYKGVVTEAHAATCRRFVAENRGAFNLAETRYGVPASVAVALLFVETRLGAVLGDVPENAFYTLASMAVSRRLEDIADWLPRMPGYEKHVDWFAEVMPKRAEWAYKETRALVEHMLRDHVPPHRLPGSIYGAVGLCQFMPSNIAVYGADGNGDGRVDLFDIPDAVASLACYLARHGWRSGLPRERQHKLLMTYNHSTVYANTILALADVVEGKAVPTATPIVSAKAKKPRKPSRKAARKSSRAKTPKGVPTRRP